MSLATALASLGWEAFSLNALSDESDAELATWLASLGFGDEALGELRRLIALAAPRGPRGVSHARLRLT